MTLNILVLSLAPQHTGYSFSYLITLFVISLSFTSLTTTLNFSFFSFIFSHRWCASTQVCTTEVKVALINIKLINMELINPFSQALWTLWQVFPFSSILYHLLKEEAGSGVFAVI